MPESLMPSARCSEIGAMLVHEAGVQVTGPEGWVAEHLGQIVRVGAHAEHRELAERCD